ncbi:acyl transferase/acyl hydrolase/lysophospholipase [Xylariaceae sp. FL0662B]|nr:acyl transferase/acyl hydrolase/lysophospholipase [Xylariaceae sp. FL0662B]
MTVASDIPTLHRELTDLKKVSEVSFQEKPVVLAFGGQSRQYVALERSLYETCPRLKHYIDICEEILVGLGFPPIVPAIFDTTPISDVVILQTATFAAQHSCVRCWIDGGLDISAVIGYSFGELTALIIPGVWTLRDGIRAIAMRANLIATGWGAERGAMLAVYATRDFVREIARQGVDCEIACLNGETSQVVVGSIESIKHIEGILVSEAKERGIRSQRLDVKHGFQSRYTEPLIDKLSSLAGLIPIHEPKIPLETCTAEKCDKITPGHLVRHIRNPVYFEDAVRRIEDRLGSCIWLEGGIDTPIVSMLKKATRNPSSHKFQALSFKSSIAKEAVLPKANVGLSQVFLPPHPFAHTPAWVENVDHTTELLLSREGDGKTGQVPEPPLKPIRLVTGLEITGREKLFVINTESNRFKAIVSSHAVRNRPLCPASIYMECAAMATQLSGIEFTKGDLCFEGLSFEHPLGLHPNRHVTTHTRGSLALRAGSNLGAYQRMVSGAINQLLSSTESEKLTEIRAYGLFSRVVTYAAILRGIKSIVMGECQALAEIQLPSGQVGTEESIAVGACDAVSLDVMIQVAGLLINSSDQCELDSVFVATGIESTTLSDADCFLRTTSWKVYTTFAPVDESLVTGDVFVLGPDGSLVLAIVGIAFTKLPISRLEKMLDGANPVAVATTNFIPGPSPAGIQANESHL